MADPAPVRVEDLLAHAGWVRSLAANLVRDPGAADDLVQETWVAAMEGPPDDDRPVRPWLAGVLRNLWKERLRGEGRRGRREAAAARPERSAFPSPDELAARLETARRLATHVAALEEPLRSTVLLRFYEGISSAEIAHRTGTPEGTVRWRLHRALAELRERLDAESGGDRRAWLAVVAPLAGWRAAPPAAGGGGAGAAAAATGGVLAMATATKATAAAAVVLAAAGLLWLGGAFPGSGPDGASSRESAARPASTVAAPLPLPSAPTPPMDAAPAPDPSSTSLNRHGVPKDPVPAAITGRVVTEAGVPVPAARVVVRVLEAEETARSGEDGTFRFDLHLPTGFGNGWGVTPGRPLTFDVSLVASARARESVARSLTLELEGARMRETSLGDVVLRPGGSIAGRVVDVDGAPVPGAWVGIEDPDHAGAPAEERRMWQREILTLGVPAVAGGTGVFLLEGVPVGPVRLWAGKERHRAGRSPLVEVQAGAEAAGVEVRVEAERPEDRIEGRVVGPDGSTVHYPLFHVRADAAGRGYSMQWNGDPESRKDGDFSLPVQFPATYHVLAVDACGRWGPALAGPLRPGDRGIVIRFPEARTVTLRVRSRVGEVVTSWQAHLSHATVPLGGLYGVKPGEHPGGEAGFLAPGFPFVMDVTAEGFAMGKVGPVDPAALPDLIECVLDPVAAARGRVLADGRPVPGARVLALRVVPPGEKCVRDDLPCRWYPDEEAEGTTGAGGAFALPLRNRGTYVFRAEAQGFAPAEIGPLDFDPARGLEGLEIRLGRGGTLEGRVLMGGALSPEGVIVVVHRGDGRPRSMRAGKDGSFRFEGLTPGPWILARHEREVPAQYMTSYGPGASEFRWNVEVEEGRTVAKDLDLTGAGRALLRGRFSPGAPASAKGWTASIHPPGTSFETRRGGGAALGADGAFELRPAGPGTWLVLLDSPDGTLRILDSVEVPEGETAWNFDLALGRVEGTLDPAGQWGLIWQGEGERWAFTEVRPDAGGRFAVPAMPSGRVRLILFDPAAPPKDPDPRRWPAKREIDVPAGGTARVE